GFQSSALPSTGTHLRTAPFVFYLSERAYVIALFFFIKTEKGRMMRGRWRIILMLIMVTSVLITPMPVKAAAGQQQVADIQQVLRENKVNGIVLIDGHAHNPRVISNQTSDDPRLVVKTDRLFPIASFKN